MKLPYIGTANSQFVIRNMGGEAIKCDRWLNLFIKYYDYTLNDLVKLLKKKDIPEGLFDIVVWAYCEEHVKKINKFKQHFDENFS